MSRIPESSRVFVDTSIAIAILRHDEAALARFTVSRPVVSVTVIGELYYGPTRAYRREHQYTMIAKLVATCEILVLDIQTADHYATLKRTLELQGMVIPENDMWIAATALRSQLPIATRDGHFDRVAGLLVERW